MDLRGTFCFAVSTALTMLFDFVCASPRSGRQNVAWGEAEGATPGLIGTHSSPRSGRQTISAARFTGSIAISNHLGLRLRLHPRLHSDARFAGSRNATKLS